MDESRAIRSALWPVLLLVPVPSVGVYAAMHVFPGPAGQTVFALSKAWILVFPLVWTAWVERQRLRWPPFRRAGVGAGVLSGLAIGGVILAVYYGVAHRWFDAGEVRGTAREIGLGRPGVYVVGALYWCLVNALLEEYVWRWFVFRHCRRLLPPIMAACVAALCFTLHHSIALTVYMNAGMNLLASTGVFTGGVVWCALYLRYRSIWAAYISHVIADLSVFWVGWVLIFG